MGGVPPETPQPGEPVPPSWRPRQNPRGSIADAIGSCLRGAREGDKHVRRRIQGWLAYLTGGGFAVYAAVLLLDLTADQVRRGWVADDRQQAALVAAIEKQTQRLEKHTEKIGALVEALQADRAKRDREHKAVLEQIARSRRAAAPGGGGDAR